MAHNLSHTGYLIVFSAKLIGMQKEPSIVGVTQYGGPNNSATCHLATNCQLYHVPRVRNSTTMTVARVISASAAEN